MDTTPNELADAIVALLRTGAVTITADEWAALPANVTFTVACILAGRDVARAQAQRRHPSWMAVTLDEM